MIQDSATVTANTRMRSIEWCYFQWIWWPLTQISRSRYYLALNISETVRDRDVVIMDLHVPYASVICF